MKKLFVFAIATMFAFSMSAQKFGVKAGINMSGYTTNFDSPEEAKMGMGSSFGVFGEYEISDLLSLRATLAANQLGSDSFEEEDGDSYSEKNNIGYMQLSVTPKISFGPAYVFVGPYFGYATSSHTVGTYRGTDDDGDDDTYQISVNNFINKDDAETYNKIDFGLNLGLGASFSNVIVEFNVGYGMVNFFNVDSDTYKYYEEVATDLNATMKEYNLTMSDMTDGGEDYVFYHDETEFVAPIQKNIFFGFSVGYMFGGE